MITIGIDPGLKGGVAIHYPDSGVIVAPMPLLHHMIDIHTLYITMRAGRVNFKTEPKQVYIEKVHSMPGQGVASMFKFGTGYGQLIGMCQVMGVPFFLVPPQTWKKHVLHGTTKDKKDAVEFVANTYPGVSMLPGKTRKPHMGIADAVCIMHYGREKSFAREVA